MMDGAVTKRTACLNHLARVLPFLLIPFALSIAGFNAWASPELSNLEAMDPVAETLPSNKAGSRSPSAALEPLSDPDLVADWSFDEGSGIAAGDATGQNRGILNGAVWSGGVEGNAVSLDGVDDYVEIAHHASQNITGAMTVTAWVQRKDILDDQDTSILRKSEGTYMLFAADDGNRPFFGDIQGWVRIANRILIPDRWTFLAVTAANNTVRFFSNVRADPIYTIGDSITAGHGGPDSHCTSNDNCPFSQGQNIHHTYQYWLDQFLGSYTSAESLTTSYYNKGYGSQTCDDVYARFAADIPDNVEVILMCGVNDFGQDDDHTEVEEDIQNIYNLAMSKNNRLIIMEILPVGHDFYCDDIVAFNAWLHTFTAANENASIVEVHDAMSNGSPCHYNYLLFESPDIVHPNEDGLKTIATEIWNQAYQGGVSGLEEQLTESHGTWNGIELTSSGSLFLGTQEDPACCPLEGDLDHAMLYSRTLSETEIQDLYNNQKPAVP